METNPARGPLGHVRPLRQSITLTDADVTEMQGLMARRDSYIRFLYEREMEFTETLGKVIAVGADDLVRRPLDIEALLVEIERMLQNVKERK